MKFRMDKVLQFWVDVAAEHIKPDHANLAKRQLVAQILQQFTNNVAMQCGTSTAGRARAGKPARGF